jgi:hypothetical protein
MMTEVTAGCATVNATASCGSEQPMPAASSANCSTASNFAALAGRVGSKRSGASAGRPADRSTSRPLRYLPDRKPQASGDQVSTPIPRRWQAGSTEASIPRASSEYGAGVHVGGVDEVDPLIEGGVDDPDALVVVGVAEGAEHHGPQAVGAHLDTGTAQGAVAHGHASHATSWSKLPAKRFTSYISLFHKVGRADPDAPVLR